MPSLTSERVHEIKIRLARAFTYIIFLIAMIVVGHAIAPFMSFAFNLMVPGFTISLGIIVYIMIFAIFSLVAIQLAKEFFHLAGSNLESLFARLLSTIGTDSRNPLKRISISIFVILFILIANSIFGPILRLLPGIGESLAAALQLVVGAIVILAVWDIGRALFRQLDRATEIIATKAAE